MKSFARVVLFSSLVLQPASVALAQVPAGGEFLVNTYTASEQIFAAVAADPAGNFVVTWNSYYPDGSAWGVFAQRHGADGQRRGAEFLVNTYTTGTQFLPRVAADRRGNFVVTWQGPPPAGGSDDVAAQRYAADGSPLGGEFAVNVFSTNNQGFPEVATDAAGNFVVVWTSESQYGYGRGVFARRFASTGLPLGSEFRVNTYTTSDQFLPTIGSDPAGNFVVVWISNFQDGSSYGIFGQRFDGAGAPRGVEFRVNTYTTGRQFRPAVAMAGSGDFVVAWSSPDGSGVGVFAQRYDAAGTPLGGEFPVNTYTTGFQDLPRVASDAAGNFVVTWFGIGDGSAYGVFGRRYRASGVPRGGQFTVNTITAGYQSQEAVASDAFGNFIVVWEGLTPLGAGADILGQRFGGLTPAALAVDPPDVGGNGVLEPTETATVRPSWRNVNGTAQTFAGTAVTFTGPLGPAYTINDAAADYGTVGNGSTASCQATGNCFAVSITGSRPSTHWDAMLREDIQPDAQGQVETWTLHVGDSFTDVPRTGVFYRFVETILHKSVTGGCGPTIYCPLASTTRDQMAVFALVSKEGAPYAPPACGAPMFADVPASSPYCRWIEELARRGVVSGCGGGNYCPSGAVTREQMAIFALKTLEGPTYTPPACGVPIYTDVPASSPFCRWIEELTRRSVVSGCGNGNYCPGEPVSREQISVFLTVTFGLLLYGV